MKKMIELLVVIKTQGAMLFSGAVMLYAVAGFFFEIDSLPSILALQMVTLAILCSAWQFFCFGDVLKGRGFALRATLFLLPLYGVLAVFAYFGKWFPMTTTAWLIFTGIFVVICPMIMGVYEAYYRITGVRFNQMLAAYKSRHANR